MRNILGSRPLRLLFLANSVSMIGSGMNTAAVTWYILQATHSEQLLGALVVAQAIPALLLMPISGVIVDREDRRHVVMMLDFARAALIGTVALLAFHGTLHVAHLFLMSVLVSTGFWMFWPTITALLQELTPEAQFAESNAMLLAGFQGGWLIAGALVGFVYNKIGTGGILTLDCCTYLFSITCYFFLRKGRHVVSHAAPEQAVHSLGAHYAQGTHPVRRFLREMSDGLGFTAKRPWLALLGVTWALFVSAMMVQSVVTAPVSDRILHSGAVGFGWLNAGWGIGAFLSTFYAAKAICWAGAKFIIPASMLLIGLTFSAVPFSVILGVTSALYFTAGTARGVGGVALSSAIMEAVPKQYMGRVQTLFSIFAIVLQVSLAPLVGRIAQRVSLTRAVIAIASLYLFAALAGFTSTRITRSENARA